MKHILSILVDNQPGVLVRVASMFSRRGFNIDSLAVGVTHDPRCSRITTCVRGSYAVVEQVIKQLRKLVVVRAVTVLDAETAVTRSMALIKVRTTEQRSEVLKLAEVFRANVVDVSASTITLEVTGDDKKIDALTTLLAPYGFLEMIRTGVIGLARGESTIYQADNGCYEQTVWPTSQVQEQQVGS